MVSASPRLSSGKVYLPAGLRYEEDRRLHPGFVTTAGAVQYCMDHGLDEYDHLAGHQIDKKAISTGSVSSGLVAAARPNHARGGAQTGRAPRPDGAGAGREDG
jgi:hypothetical protein